MINELILFAGIFLPFVEIEKYHNIKYPFIYALVTPSEISLADVLLCAQRIWLHKSDKKDTVASRWIPLVIFVFLCIPFGYVSFHSQVYTVTYEQERSNFLFACFLTDNITKGVFSTCSFVGYTGMFVWVKKRKIEHDTIIRQALPIAIFQLFVIGAQTFLEFQPNPKLSPHARIFLDICFSAACTVAVPFCIVIGDSEKREIFYSTPCCCYCYCQPRPPPQITIQKEANSRAERQKMEEEAAIKERRQEKEKRRKQREMENNFHNLDDSLESNESGI
ncbi:hypothetical protein L3Y34_018313 [Caenorhabditis briggsae]|nr:hypothetical protein L3Y34_018313 [Caenorhabditis briggsae]